MEDQQEAFQARFLYALTTLTPFFLLNTLTLIGIRGSFLKAFQVFEQHDQLFTSDSSKVSASVANTMHLQANFKVKNVLATRNNPAAAKYSNGK